MVHKVNPVRKFVGNFKPFSSCLRSFFALTTIQGGLLSNGVKTFRPAYKRAHTRSQSPFLSCLLFVGFLYMFAATETEGAKTYYLDIDGVGPDGIAGTADDVDSSDSNPGTRGRPWKTLNKAISTVDSGDTVYLRDGDYGNFVNLNHQYTDWVTYEAEDGQTPIFSCPDASGNAINLGRWGAAGVFAKYHHFKDITIKSDYALNVSGAGTGMIRLHFVSHVKFEDCNIVGGGYAVWDKTSGIWISGSSNIEIRGCSFYGAGTEDPNRTGVGTAIYGDHQDNNNIIIDNCEIQQCGTGILARGSNYTISNNHIHDLTWEGIWAHSLVDSVIEDNHIHDIVELPDAPGHADCIKFGAHGSSQVNPENVIVRRNHLHHSDRQCLFLNGFFPQAINITIENNLIYKGNRAGIGGFEIQVISVDGLTFVNNTVVGKMWLRSGIEADKVILQNNIIYLLDHPDGDNYAAMPGEDNNIINKWWVHVPGGYVQGKHTVELEDDQSFRNLFVDYDNDNYSLASDSLAIDFGTATSAPSDDLDGDIRDAAPPPDAGCYEYVPSGSNNQAPVLQEIGDKSVNENTLLTFTVTASDPDGDTITYSAQNLPSGATFSIQTFSWTPSPSQAGTDYPVTFIATDPCGAYDPKTITITVNNMDVERTLTISSTAGGSVTTPSEGTSQHDHETDVSLVAVASANYSFVNWTGTAVDAGKVANANAASTTVTADADYTLVANFAIDTHTLTISSTSGGSASTPGEGAFQYNHGSAVSVQTTPLTNYHFVNWTGTAVTAGKVTNANAASTMVTADADYTLVANFSIDQYTLTISSTSYGSVTTPGEGAFQYDHGTAVPFVAIPTGSNYFVNWTGTAVDAGKVANASAASTTVTADADYTLVANFAEQDVTDPIVTNLSPQEDSIQVSLNSLILLDVTDSGKGVDADTVTVEVNGNLVYTGNATNYSSSYGKCRRIGNSAAYKYIYQPNEKFDFDQAVTVTVNATDLTANPMDEYSYSFKSEMRSFGEKKTLWSLTDGRQVISSGANKDDERPLTSVSDSSGNIWVAWTEGDKDTNNNLINRDVYLGKITVGAESFESSDDDIIQVTNDAPDQANPVLAIDSSDNLYLVWQDKRLGNWDLYVLTSTDGINWSNEMRITDPNYNQTNPAMAIDSSDEVYIVYDDDQNTDKDIYIASSADNYVSKTQISSAVYDQTTPDIAIDSADTVYVVWADARGWNGKGKNPKYDIYGAASNNSWTNVLIATENDQQLSPKIATEAAGTILHFVWVDDGPGDKEVYYGSSDGLPGTPLTGTNIIDSDLPADVEQKQPAVAVTGYTGGMGNDVLKVFACWEDERYSGIENIHAVEITNLGTNIWVGDDGAGADQKVPAIGIDQYNEPFLVWINNKVDIIYSGSTFADPDPLISPTLVSASTNTTVGTAIASIADEDDASVFIPAGGYVCDIEVTISRIRNPQKLPPNNHTFLYEFGPSGTTFSEPVTITIPYHASSLVSSPSAYWYNPLTGLYSQTGITDAEVIEISSGLYALRFKTTHFSGFGGGGPFGGGDPFGGGGGGGGGGCSMSPNSQGHIMEFLLPYIGLTVVMVILKLRDVGKRKARNITKSER